MRANLTLVLTLMLTGCVATTQAPAPVAPHVGTGQQAAAVAGPAGYALYQSGRVVPAQTEGGQTSFHLESRAFEIRTPHKSMRIYLAEKDAGEWRQSGGRAVHVLSVGLVGATTADARALFVADADDPLSSNNWIGADNGLRTISSTLGAYEVRSLVHLKTGKEQALSSYRGVLTAYVWVDLNADNMMDRSEVSRVRLAFGMR